MAYHQARSGVCYSGAVYAGVADPDIFVTVSSTTRTSSVMQAGSVIEQRLNSRASATLYLTGFEPSIGQDVKIGYRSPNEYVFAGTITALSCEVQSGHDIIWEATVSDYLWLLDRYKLVNAAYFSRDINSVVATILNSYTDGGFTVGSIPQAFGAITATGIQFDKDRVSSALDRLADIGKGWWTITPDKRINMFTNYTDGNAVSIGNSSDLMRLRYTQDLTQIRTQSYVEGIPTSVAIATPAGATTVPVASAKGFSPSGGKATVSTGTGVIEIAYTSVQTTTDPVTGEDIYELTGVTGVTDDIPTGEPIKVASEYDDATAQSSLATILSDYGGGISGVSVSYFEDDDAPQDATDDFAEGDVDRFQGSSPLKSVEFETYDPFIVPGKVLTFSITSPITISASIRVQSVTLEYEPSNGGRFRRRVFCGQSDTDLPELIQTALARTGAVG